MSKEVNKDLQKQKDSESLAKFGYHQELFREMGGFSNFAISFSIISILTGLVSMFGYGVNLMGPACYWTWVVMAFFQLFNAMAMGEIASSYPLAGGLYQWARHLGNADLGWWVGWINLIAWWAVTVAIDFALGTFLAGSGWFGLKMNTSTTVLLTLAIMTIHAIMNIFGIKLVAWFNNFSVWVHIIGTVMLMALLLWLGKVHSLSYILSTQTPIGNISGVTHPSFWFAFMPAILMSAWTLMAFDASADVSEETKDPQHTVPWGMVIAVVASFIFGSFVLIGLDLALPPIVQIPKIMQTTGLATYIIQTVMGPTWSLIVMAIIALAMFACGLSAMTVYQRVIFSLARDKNLPFSDQLKKVSSKGVPYVATIVGTILMAVLVVKASLLATVTSIASLAFFFGYFIVIIIAVHARVTGKWKELGPWNLGKYGIAISAVAIIWNLYICVAVVLPPNFLTLQIFLGIMVVLAVYYVTVMRKKLRLQHNGLSQDELEKMERSSKLHIEE